MNEVLKIFLSMSVSGGLLILTLLLGKQFLKDKISRQWQYYIWLVVVFRLILPFGPEGNLLGKTYQAVGQTIAQAVPLPSQQLERNTSEELPVSAVDLGQNRENANNPVTLLTSHVWLIWLAAALGLLIQKITAWQSFIRYVRAGMTPVSDMELLDRLSIAAKREGIRRPIELCVNPLVSSPMLIGFFHPCIVLPGVDISEKDFPYIVLHELTHYKRRDMFYKWLVQVTVCLHWFNPLVHFMSREIARACEFSCDEAVLVKMESGNAQDYGKTLLNAMAAVGKYRENPGAVTLSGNKKLLKERLAAIMNFKRKSGAVRLLTGALTLCVIAGAAFVGVYPVAAASGQPSGELPVSSQPSSGIPVSDQSSSESPVTGNRSGKSLAGKQNAAQAGTGERNSMDYASRAEQYYEADSLPLFEITFPRLDENTQKMWLERFYANGDFAFFSVALRGLSTNPSLLADFAQKAYVDEEIAFFSTLADSMDEAELELWLNRALEDGKWDFQSILSDRLDKNDKFDELEEEKEKEWEAAQAAEYEAVGVTMDGRDYYYQGQLVNIFLDIRADKSFYTLSMNPAGTIHIKIIRDADNQITGAANMTEAEVTELLGDMT